MNKLRMFAAFILAIALLSLIMLCKTAQAKAAIEDDEPNTIIYDPSPRGQIGT